MPDGVDMHLFRWVRKASMLRGVRARRARSWWEDFAAGGEEEEDDEGVGVECGMGSPLGRSAMGFVGAAVSDDILKVCCCLTVIEIR